MRLRISRILTTMLLAANLACHDAPNEPLTSTSSLNLDG
jgi:hypothetical protein